MNNELVSLTGVLPTHSIENITSLDLESNHIKCLSDVSSLAHLRLKTLALNFNNISKVSNELDKPLRFGSELKRVELAFNEIGDWQFINELSSVFPGLDNLRVSHNPLYDNAGRSAEDGYLLTIARISNLKTLNFSPVCINPLCIPLTM
jgi:tubulin-specific chaperone E